MSKEPKWETHLSCTSPSSTLVGTVDRNMEVFFIRLNNRDFYPDTPYEIFVRELIAKVLEIHI